MENQNEVPAWAKQLQDSFTAITKRIKIMFLRGLLTLLQSRHNCESCTPYKNYKAQTIDV